VPFAFSNKSSSLRSIKVVVTDIEKCLLLLLIMPRDVTNWRITVLPPGDLVKQEE
jgi:hypothetical protein